MVVLSRDTVPVTILKCSMHFIKKILVPQRCHSFQCGPLPVYEFDLCAFLTDREAVRKAAAAGVRALADIGEELDTVDF